MNEDIEARIAAIEAAEPEAPTEEDVEAIRLAEAENDYVDLEEFKKDLEAYSGRIVLRIPRSLHRSLKANAAAEGVSLNQYMLYKLAQ